MSINFKELMNARYMALQLVPTSAAAHSLCKEIVRKIEFLEERKRRRKRLDKAKFEDAVE